MYEVTFWNLAGYVIAGVGIGWLAAVVLYELVWKKKRESEGKGLK